MFPGSSYFASEPCLLYKFRRFQVTVRVVERFTSGLMVAGQFKNIAQTFLQIGDRGAPLRLLLILFHQLGPFLNRAAIKNDGVMPV